MTIQSLGYRTDLRFVEFDGVVLSRDGYKVVRTPQNPSFYWGNFILFDSAPVEGDYPRWREIFRLELGEPPMTHHQAFGWDSVDGEKGASGPFEAAGFQVDHATVLTASSLHPPVNVCTEVEIRPLGQEWEWQAAIDNRVLSRPESEPEGTYRIFAGRQLARYKAMSAAGRGAWFGAFIGEKLIGDLGLFHWDGLARYQSVGTHPDFRRRGVCGTLVYQASEYARLYWEIGNFVIVAEHGSHAAAIYERLGFTPREHQMGLTLPSVEGTAALRREQDLNGIGK